MPDQRYRTTPNDTDRMPPGIPFIIGNEAAERFSFYGMRAILTIFMTEHLRTSAGGADLMTDEQAKWCYHLFVATAYFFPILGSLIADVVWGKYKTILILSLGYCVGHACLAMGDTGLGAGLLEPRYWLFLGLVFIAIGAGGIKPCVSAHVGDQFGPRNQGLISKTFSWFYFSINVGAVISQMLTPVLLEHKDFGPAYAFGIPGVLMAIATLLFWLGRNRFVHIPPAGREEFVKETLDKDGVRALLNLSPLFLVFVPLFWSIFDQTGSSWVLQATRLDRQFLGVTWYEAQVQAVNPALILILIPTFAYVLYPLMGKFFEPTPLRKIGIGLFLTAAAFGVTGWIEGQLTGGAVLRASSQANRDQWRAIHLLDGDPASGWASTPEWGAATGDAPPAEHEIVVRLREYREWPINSVVLHPLPAEAVLPEPRDSDLGLSEKEAAALREGAACRARTIEIAIADSPKPADGWETIATVEMDGGPTPTTFEFAPVEAGYVRLAVRGNRGGAFVGLGEVEILTQGDAATDDAAATWPNVAALGERPTIGWQFLAYLILTAAEVMVSIVCLEFAYTQAPRKMKSFVMGVYFLGVSLGNLVAAGVNLFIVNADGTTILEGAAYYHLFTIAMLVSAVGYVAWSFGYKGQTFIQGESIEEGPADTTG